MCSCRDALEERQRRKDLSFHWNKESVALQEERIFTKNVKKMVKKRLGPQPNNKLK
jgi:hypothetical protein